MGGLFSSKTKSTKTPFESNPWQPQQEYLKKGFENSLGAYNDASAAFKNEKDWAADLTPGQLAAIRDGTQFGQNAMNMGQSYMNQGQAVSNQGQGIVNQGKTLANIGQNATLSGMNTAQSNIAKASNGLGGIAKAAQGTGSGAINATGQASNMTAKANGLADRLVNQAGQYADQNAGRARDLNEGAVNYGKSAIDRSLGQVQGYGVDDLASQAGALSNNPHLQGQIDSAINDVNKGFQRTQAGINAAASGAGGMNSTRAGVLESRALDDAQDRAATISSGMRGDAWNQGLNTALSNKSSVNQNNLNALGQANATQGQMFGQQVDAQGIRQFGQSMNLNAMGQAAGIQQASAGLALDGGQLNMQGRESNLNSLLASNNQQLAVAGAGQNFMQGGQNIMQNGLGYMQGGLDFMQGGQNMAQGGYAMGSAGLADRFGSQGMLQAQNQREIDGRLARASGQMGLAQQYMQTIGGNYGTNGYNTQVTQSASPFQQIVGGAATIGGMMMGKPPGL